jgi:hypothetical protein
MVHFSVTPNGVLADAAVVVIFRAVLKGEAMHDCHDHRVGIMITVIV